MNRLGVTIPPDVLDAIRQADSKISGRSASIRRSVHRLIESDRPDIVPEFRDALQRADLDFQADLHHLNSALLHELANATWEKGCECIEGHYLKLFSLHASYLSLFAIFRDPNDIDRVYGQCLVTLANGILEAVNAVLSPASESFRDDVLHRVGLELAAQTERLVAQASERMLEVLGPPVYPRRIPKTLVRRRRELIANYRRKNDDMPMVAFCLKVGLSETSVFGIIKENRDRFGITSPAQAKLLRLLGVTRDEWYGAKRTGPSDV